MYKLYLILPVLFFTLTVKAQLYTVKGKVTGTSIEPLSFVSVNVEGKVNNTETDKNGEFKLELANGKYTFIFTLLGYKPFKKEVIVNNAGVYLNVLLEEDLNLLKEVEIGAKYTDPARGVVKQVIKNKGKYLQNGYQCELYIKAVESEDKQKLKIDSTQQKRAETDSTALPEKKKKSKNLSKKDSLHPKFVYDKLNMAEILIKKSFEYPDKVKEERTAVKSRGDIESLFYLHGTEGEFNFYENAVDCPSLSEAPLQSPFSTGGLLMYKYKTVKVFYEDGQRIFRIRVEPNLIANALVSGEMDIIDSLFCLKRFHFSFPKYQLSEYTSFDMDAEFVPYDDSLYRINKLDFNYKMGSKKKGASGRTVVYVDNFNYEKKFAKRYFNNEVSTTLEEAYKKDTAFWQQIRKEPLTEKELKFIRISDSIAAAHTSKTYLDSIDRDENKITFKKVALLGQTRYNRDKELRFFYDPLWRIYQPVGVGGARLRYGMGISKTFPNKKNIRAFFNPSYGILNEDLNGTVTLSSLYNTYKRGFITINVGKNYDIINTNASWLSVFRTANYFLNEHISISHSLELFNGLTWEIKAEYSTRKSIDHIKNDSLTNALFENYKYKPVAFDLYDAFYINNELSYAPFQKYIREPKEKIILGSKFPTFSVSYRKGIPKILNSSIDYDYLEYSIAQEIDMGFWGISKYNLSTGKFFSKRVVKTVDYKYQAEVGFPFFANPLTAFQSLEKSYYTLNRFYTGHYFHRFNGAILNKIPFMKILKLTESGGGGFLLSEENNLNYFEVFVGVERNVRILREMFRIGVFWVNGKTNDYPFRSGIRFSINYYDKFNNKWVF